MFTTAGFQLIQLSVKASIKSSDDEKELEGNAVCKKKTLLRSAKEKGFVLRSHSVALGKASGTALEQSIPLRATSSGDLALHKQTGI